MCFSSTYWLLSKDCGKYRANYSHYRALQNIHWWISFNIHHILFLQSQSAILTSNTMAKGFRTSVKAKIDFSFFILIIDWKLQQQALLFKAVLQELVFLLMQSRKINIAVSALLQGKIMANAVPLVKTKAHYFDTAALWLVANLMRTHSCCL